jgi:integrase
MATVKLTDRLVARLQPPSKGNQRTYDSEVTGFAARVTTAGHRAFVFRYRSKDGRERLSTIGEFPAWSTTAARARAAELRRTVDLGGDPCGDTEALRDAPTVTDLAERFRREHVAARRPNTRRDYELLLRNEILPSIGSLKVAAVTPSDIDNLHRKITERGAGHQANRTAAVLSKMFSLSVRWRLRSTNPVQGLERNVEHPRSRYLTESELPALLAAIEGHSDKQAARVFRFLLLTGCRRSEAQAATWDQLDLRLGVWVKAASATKQGKLHRVPLSVEALDLLRRIRAEADATPWVFPRAVTHVPHLNRNWRAVCRAAGIDGLRLHDLRHSFASLLVGEGLGLPIVGALLGHSRPATTNRYAHLSDEPLRAATERVGKLVAAASGSPRKVVTLPRT